MSNKSILIVSMIIVIGAITGTGMYYTFPVDTEPSKLTYIPSDITKANSNILVGSGESSIRTTHINDVADTISITVEGTVLEVGDPIHWFDARTPTTGHGTVPVTISVEQVHKGGINSETFTFYIDGMLRNWDLTLGESIQDVSPEDRIFYLFPWEPQFEIGEKVLLHIRNAPPSSTAIIEKLDLDLLSQSQYKVQLGKYGKYQIHDTQAFNEKFSTGISVQSAISQSKSP